MIGRMRMTRFGSLTALVATALLAAACRSGDGVATNGSGADASSATTQAPASASAPSSSPRPTEAGTTAGTTAGITAKPRVTTTPHSYRADLERSIAALPKGSVSVAAVNLKTGVQFSGGSKDGHWMASTYKLFLTEAQLADDDSIDDDDAAAAIEHSDNAAGYRLYLALGGTSGTKAAIRRFGLTHTDLPGDAYDPTFTTTSATDWVRILRHLVGPGRLTASQRAYVLSLMRQVDPDQRWGVGAAATGPFVNKNGWETVDSGNTPPEPDDDGRWITNSVGIVTRHGQQLLMAVLTQHNPDFDSGVRLVERLAVLAGAAVTS